MNTTEDIFKGYGVEIDLADDQAFLKIKETLTRMGVASNKEKSLYQSCHILHKKGRYAILHFKELFSLDGKESNFSEEDKLRRNTIVNLLDEWGLLIVKNEAQTEDEIAMNKFKIISFKDKQNWNLVPKYSIGK